MLFSVCGWGMLCNIWSDGIYDLCQVDQVILLYCEDCFDVYYFVGFDLYMLLDCYIVLIGCVVLLLCWVFLYGDVDCYNDGDNCRKFGSVFDGWSDGLIGIMLDVVDSVVWQYCEYDMFGGWILFNDGYGCGYMKLFEIVQGLVKYGFRIGLWIENGVDKIVWEVGIVGSCVQKLDVVWIGKGYQFVMDVNQFVFNGILYNFDFCLFLWMVMGWGGIQCYVVVWIGDQSSSWDYICWYILILIGLGLFGMVYVSGDVDVIFGGSVEIFICDLQWKSFMLVLMGMFGWLGNVCKYLWWFDEFYCSVNCDYFKLKMCMILYMYGLVYDVVIIGVLLLCVLMWDYFEDLQVYIEVYKYQFLFGCELLIVFVY